MDYRFVTETELRASHAELPVIRVRLATLSAELRAAREQRDEALRVIRGIEWIYKNGHYYCPWCEIPRELGHAENCTLAAVLAMGTGEGGGRE